MSRKLLAALGGTALLAGCAVTPPTGPSILALPSEGKPLAQFQQEDFSCRDYAQASIGPVSPQGAATQAGVGSAVAGTAIGAAAGALIGAAVGNPGAGAAVGAGAGLLTGSSVGANNAAATGYSLQARYDAAYAQCIASSGNRIEGPIAAGYAVPYAAPYAYGPGYGYGPSVSFGFYGGGYRPYGYRPYFGPRYGWRRF